VASIQAATEEVRAHTELLLDSIGITRIVVVDDEYARVTVEDLIGLCSDLDTARAAQLPYMDDIRFDGDRDIWAKQLRELWQDLNEGQRSEVVMQAHRLHDGATAGSNDAELGDGGAGSADMSAGNASAGDRPLTAEDQPDSPREDVRAASALEELLSGLSKCAFVPLSLSEWRERSKELLEGGEADSTLFLFDRDFQKEQQSQNEGIELVRAVQRGYCGLITHTVSISEEYEAWSRLADEHRLEKDRFVVIAKQRLTGAPPGDYSFLRMVRLAALSGCCAAIKMAAWEIFERSVEGAKAAMERLSVLDFDQIVLASPRREGVWEPDTLFRVFAILMRHEARERLYGDDGAMRPKVAEARRISALPLDAEGAFGAELPCREAVKIQRLEMYEPGDFLNQYCLPIELGDIFEDAKGRRYLLLAQPCDLMVRPNGKRNYDDKCGRTAALIELIVGEPPLDARPRLVEVPLHDEGTGRSAFVDFGKAHQVQLSVLDLCALNQEGEAVIDVDRPCPSIVLGPWVRRYGDLRRLYQTALKRYEKLAAKQLTEELKNLGLPVACTTARFKATIDGTVLRYELHRRGRLNQPRSGALLTAFAQYQSRAAFEHDLDDRGSVSAEMSAGEGDTEARESAELPAE
jgi:hypothetical protein